MENKFLFITLAVEGGYHGVNHGIAYLSPRVKKHSFDVACLEINTEISHNEFIDNIKAFNPSIVGFSCTTNQKKYLIKYSMELKKYSNILQIAGGPGPTLDPEGFLYSSEVNGVCIGEGEVPLDNLLVNINNKKSVFDTDGFYWLVDGKIRKNPVCQYISDISLLDFPDYSIFERENVCMQRKATDMISYGKNIASKFSRGCIYNCSYCCAGALKNVYPASGGYFRLPSVEYSIESLKRMIEMYPETKSVNFNDDLLIGNKTWFKHFAEEYAKKINMPYGLMVRTENINSEIINSLITSGCCMVYIGLENGNEDFRKRFLNRKYSNKQFIESCAMVKEAGLRIYTFNMVGFPFETRKELEDTLNLNEEVAPSWGICSFFFPFKGTKLYDTCHDNNLLLDEEEMVEISNYNTRPVINLSAEQEKNCIEFHEKINKYLNEQYDLSTKFC